VAVLVGAAWISAGVVPLAAAVNGLAAPIDFVRDYGAAHARVHGGRGTAPADEAGNDYAAALDAPRVVLLGGPYHLHPPPAQLPSLPLVPLGFRGAAAAWLALSQAALAALAFLLVVTATRSERPPPWLVAGVYLLLVLWPPALHNVAKGQWSIALAALVLAGWHSLERGRHRAAGVWLGLAASVKATPLLLLGYLLLRQRRAAAAMLATLATAGAASLVVSGLAPWRAWLADAPRDVVAWQTWTANTASVGGLFARLLASSGFSRPLVEAPRLPRALTFAVSALALAVVAWRTAGARAATPPTPQDRRDDRRLFAAWTGLVVLLNPLAWSHTLLLALIPLALLVGEAPPWALGAALVVMTIPRETLEALAGPLPVAPLPGLWLSLHAGAVALLVAVALRAPRAKG
jgi:hypothetical protein